MENSVVSTNTSKRIPAIDYLKAISIIFIVFSHINNYNAAFKLWTISFSPIVFFFSRGMVFRQKISSFSDWKKFILDRIVSILAPYFVWALIYSKLELGNILKIAYGSHEALSLSGSLTSLWFLPCMFMADIIFEVILCLSEKIKSRRGSIIFIALMSLILAVVCMFIPHFQKGLPFGADVALQAAVWVGLGYITMQIFREKITSENGGKSNMILLFLAAAAGLGLSLTAYLNTDMSGGYVMVAEARYGVYPIYLVSTAGGVLFLTSLSFILARIKNRYFVKFMQTTGMNTMIIFAVHKFVIFTVQDMLEKIPVSVPDVPALIIVFICAMAVSLVAAPIINIYIPFLAGRMKYKGIWREKTNGKN